MKILHTSDWHVGKALRGHSRADEHRAVLAEIAETAADRDVDVVVVAGDLFETATPTAESEAIVYEALLSLAEDDRTVIVLAGNHDNPRRLRAVAPLLELGRVHVASTIARPDEGGVGAFETSDGEHLEVAMVPFVSQRGVIRAEEILGRGADERSGMYADRLRGVVQALTHRWAAGTETVNVVGAHLMIDGGLLGGGERSAHTIFDYAVPATAFPASAHYVALGHLHRAQTLPGPCPVRYCGSPIHLDFGEESDTKSVTLIDVSVGRPAQIQSVSLEAGRRLRTIEGSLDELRLFSDIDSDDFLRVRVREQLAAGLADEVRRLFPNAVDITVVREPLENDDEDNPRVSHADRPPHETFEGYLRHEGVDDTRVQALFAELLDEASGTGSGV